MTQTLHQFLKENLPWGKGENLAELMNTSKNRVTRMLEDPKSMTKEEIYALASLLGSDPEKHYWGYFPIQLFENFKCGLHKLTVPEVEEMRKHKESETELFRKNQQLTIDELWEKKPEEKVA